MLNGYLATIFRPPCPISISNPYFKDSTMWWDNMHIQPATMFNYVTDDIHCKPIFIVIWRQNNK